MAGLVKLAMLLSDSGVSGFPGRGPDIRGVAGARMSGLVAGCPGPVGLASLDVVEVGAPGAGRPGSWPDVRGLEGELVLFRWFSSSMDLAACPSSRASSGGPS